MRELEAERNEGFSLTYIVNRALTKAGTTASEGSEVFRPPAHKPISALSVVERIVS